MYPKIKILLWERWHRTFIGLAILFTLYIFLLLSLLSENQPIETVLTLSVSMLYVICTLLLICLLNQSGGIDNINIAFPKRLFNYPASTYILVSTYLLYGIIIISIPFFIVFMFQKAFFSTTSIEWSTLLQIESVYIALQALCWIGGSARYLYIGISLTAIYAIYKIAGSFNLIISKNILCTFIILFSLITSYWSVSEYRKGNWLNTWNWTAIFSVLFRRKSLKHFASPLQAQVWFELRQTGHLFPVTALSFILVILATNIYGAILSYKYNNQLVLLTGSLFHILTFLPFAAFIAGLLSLRTNYRDYASGASGFWLRRPITTHTLSTARLQAVLLSIVRVFIMLAAIVLMTAIFDLAISKLTLKITLTLPVKWVIFDNSSYNIITYIVFGMLAYFLSYWISLRMAPLLFALLYSFFLLFLWSGGDARFSLIINLFTIALPIFVITGFYKAIQRRLVTKTSLIIAGCAFLLIFLSLIPYPELYSFDSAFTGIPVLNIITASRLISLSTLPLIPLFSTPFIMDRLRHR